jgi:transposase
MPDEETEKYTFLTHKALQEVAPVLSEESYHTLLKELKGLKRDAPCASGIGIIHLHSLPTTFEECQEKVRLLRERLDWTRQVCFLFEILERDTRRKNRQLKKENQQLKEANEELSNEVKRAREQLKTVLGVKKSKKRKDTVKDNEGNTQNEKQKKRGAPKGHRGQSRSIPNHVDTVVDVPPPDICPYCGHSHITVEEDFISKYVEDIPPIVKTIEERRYYRGTCAHCQGSVIQPEAISGPPVIVGDNLVSLLAVMRHRMGSSYRKLSQLCSDTFHIPLTPAGVLGILNRVCQKLEPVYKGIESSLPTQAVLHGDETGWRMDGQKWYLWCLCNRQLVYFHADPSRGAKVPKAILGSDFSGILHADFYAAYNFVAKTQRCLIHLQRAINDELKIRPNDTKLQRLHDGIRDIIVKGQKVKKMLNSHKKQTQRKQLDKKLVSLTKLTAKHKKTKALIKRIIRYQHDLLRFVDHQDVEYHNNRAERTLRPPVIFRKLSFGNRTTRGARNFSILISTLETCRLKKKNLTDFIKSAWETPQEELHFLTRSLLDTS